MNNDKRNEKDTQKENVNTEKGQKDPREHDSSKKQQLNKEDLPDSTNESKGTMGSGQRQDSN